MTMVGKKRSHKNTRRLTAKERARAYLKYWGMTDDSGFEQEKMLVRMLGSHARQTLARDDRRDK